jgi:hypothetical protein
MSPATFVGARIPDQIAKGHQLAFGLSRSMDHHGPSESQDPQAGEFEPGRTLAIVLELLRGVVETPAVQLNDQPPLWPVGIHQEALDVHVHLRTGEAESFGQVEKLELKDRPGISRQRVKLVDQATEPLDTSPSGAFEDAATQLGKVESAGHFSFVQNRRKPFGVEYAGQVYEGSCDSRDWNTVESGDFVRTEVP